MKKKTRSIKEGIIYYTILVIYIIFALLISLMFWSFGNIFESGVWLFIMGVSAGLVILYPLTKPKSE